ncbi:MAG: hypothetical protein HC901_01995 [Bdellovibrionaceae bacterium]|nr:hypothetical protein [Pseudobdellovibrionaceae bacterium]
MQDCHANEIACFENDGLVTMEDCQFDDGFIHSDAEQYVRDNIINSSYIVTEFTSAPPRGRIS